MAIVNLGAIFAKIRRLTGSADPSQLPDFASVSDSNSVGLADYVNSFYLYDFPSQFRSLKLKDVLTFNTVFGVDTYPFDSEKYTTVEMPCRCAKKEILLFQEPWSFYGVNFNWQNIENFATGNNTAGPYSGLTNATPIIRSVNNDPTNIDGTPNVPGVSQGYSGYPSSRVQNILITTNIANGSTLNVTDDGSGNLIGDAISGSINYATGQISNLVFTQTVPSGAVIQIQYNPVVPTMPLSILFYQNQFTLRPVPNGGYTIELTAYRQPTQALMDTPSLQGTPELSEWWECIAVGAAKKIFEDRLDTDGMMLMDKMLKERYGVVYTRTYAQMGSKQRISTIFEQGQQNYGSGPFGFGSGIGGI